MKDIKNKEIGRNFRAWELSFYEEWGNYGDGSGHGTGDGYFNGNGIGKGVVNETKY
jgi:hypothetical protein